MKLINLLKRSPAKTDDEINAFHTFEHGLPIGTITVGVGPTNIKTMEIWVYQDEETKPHFHVTSEQNGFYSAIRLDIPEYFVHGKYRGTLSFDEVRALNDFLSERYTSKYIKGTNWDFLADSWDIGSKKRYRCKAKTMPDYMKLDSK